MPLEECGKCLFCNELCYSFRRGAKMKFCSSRCKLQYYIQTKRKKEEFYKSQQGKIRKCAEHLVKTSRIDYSIALRRVIRMTDKEREELLESLDDE